MGEEQWWTALRKSLGDRRVIPEVAPGRTTSIPQQDAIAPEPLPASDESAAAAVQIVYIDGADEPSERRVSFRSLTGHYGNPTHINAWCHERRAWRQFRIDRIHGMFCVDSGEVLDPLQHCLELHRRGALKVSDIALTNLMRIVTFMARCDGEFHSLERSALEDILGRYFRFFGGDDDAYGCAVREAPRLAPDAEGFLKAMRIIQRMPRAPEFCRFVLNSCGSVIDADGLHAQEEVYWAVEVSSMLKRIADQR